VRAAKKAGGEPWSAAASLDGAALLAPLVVAYLAEVKRLTPYFVEELREMLLENVLEYHVPDESSAAPAAETWGDWCKYLETMHPLCATDRAAQFAFACSPHSGDVVDEYWQFGVRHVAGWCVGVDTIKAALAAKLLPEEAANGFLTDYLQVGKTTKAKAEG
jgi:hypothetical protein